MSLSLVNPNRRTNLLEVEGISIVRNRRQCEFIPLLHILLDIVELVEDEELRVGTERQPERRVGCLGDFDERTADCKGCKRSSMTHVASPGEETYA